jgi:hypothetical protein
MWLRVAYYNLARYVRPAGRRLETHCLGGPPNLKLTNNYAGYQAGYLRQWFSLTRLVLVFVTYLLNDLPGNVHRYCVHRYCVQLLTRISSFL